MRLVRLGHLDANLCCGTHVSDLAQLQMVKVVGAAERSKRPGRSRINFVVGGRAVAYLENCIRREQVRRSMRWNNNLKRK